MQHRSNTARRLATFVLITALEVRAAHAQEQPRARNVRATVVRLDQGDLVVDLGSDQGISEQTTFTLYRPITVRHPLTGRALRDRFAISVVRPRVVGRVLTLVQVPEGMLRAPAVGDELEAEVAASATAAGASASASASASSNADRAPNRVIDLPRNTQTTSDASGATLPTVVSAPGATPEETALVALWLRTMGRSPEERAVEFRRFLSQQPGSSRAALIRRELEVMARLSVATREAARAQQLAESNEALIARSVAATNARGGSLPELEEGESPELSLQALPIRELRTVLVHVRSLRATAGETFETFGARINEDGFVRASIPPQFVRAPGLQYFVEAVRNDGTRVDLLGEGRAPITVTVHPPPPAQRSPRDATSIEVRAELVDRNRFRGNDWYLQVEADFFQRLSLGPLYGYRVGFTVYRGASSSLQQLDTLMAPPTVLQAALGYHELEFAIAPIFSLVVRGSVGMDVNGLVGGAQVRARIGAQDSVWLLVGGEVIAAVGQRGFAQLMFRPAPSVRVGALAEVTHFAFDQGDPSFRIAASATWQIARWIGVGARLGYQARNIEHSGMGGGLTLRFDW